MKKLSLDIASLLRQHFPQLAEPALQEELVIKGVVYQFEVGEVIMDC